MNLSTGDAVSVLANARRRFPECEVAVHPFPALWPVYEVNLTVTALSRHDLSTASRFILRLANLQVNQPSELAGTLGLSEDYVAGASAELLRSGHVVQRPDMGIELTDEGRRTLLNGGRSFIPQNHYLKVPYDPLTGGVTDLDARRLSTLYDARRGGEFVIPVDRHPPRLSNLPMDDVRAVARGNRYFRDREISEITQISQLKDSKLKYRSDLTLVGMREPGAERPFFAVYRRRQYLREQTEALRRLTDAGADLTPQEANPEQSKAWVDIAAVSSQERERLSDLADLAEQVGKVDREISIEKELLKTADSQQERAASSARIKELEANNRDLENRLAQAERQLEEDSQGKESLLKTEEHRAVLLRAISQAHSELTLVSAWITPRAFDGEVRRGIVNALRRGATVRIAWGMPESRNSEGSRNRENGNNAISRLRKIVPKGVERGLTVKYANTHQKFIICDDSFCAAGSLNWLSYRGEIDSGYRTEVSLYSESRNIIDLYKAQAEGIFA